MTITRLSNDPTTQYESCAEGKIRVRRSHEVVSHDADAARQPFEAIGRIGLEDVCGADRKSVV